MFRKAFAITALSLAAASAHATFATSVQISNAIPDYLQVSEVVATQAGSFMNVALASAGATATATSVYSSSSAPGYAIDGVFPSAYPNIYHSAGGDGTDVLTVTFAQGYDLSSLTIYGRTDCCSNRDIYSYQLFNGLTQVASGTINATGADHVGTSILQVSAVPEPETYAMLLAGMGLVGFVAKRRKPASKAGESLAA